jgi:hypothetical protein
VRFDGSAELTENRRSNLVPIAELAEIGSPDAVKKRLFIGAHPALKGLVDPFILLGLDMLYLNEHQIAVAGKVWEFPFSGFLILPVVEGSAAKMAGDECLKRAGRSGPPVRSM